MKESLKSLLSLISQTDPGLLKLVQLAVIILSMLYLFVFFFMVISQKNKGDLLKKLIKKRKVKILLMAFAEKIVDKVLSKVFQIKKCFSLHTDSI